MKITNGVWLSGEEAHEVLCALGLTARGNAARKLLTRKLLLEPTGRHAVIRDREGEVYRREGIYWRSELSGRYSWDFLARNYSPITVLFEGVEDD